MVLRPPRDPIVRPDRDTPVRDRRDVASIEAELSPASRLKLQGLLEEITREDRFAGAVEEAAGEVVPVRGVPGERYFVTVDVAVERGEDGTLVIYGFSNPRMGPVIDPGS